MSLALLRCCQPGGAAPMAIHKFNFAQIPLTSLKKLLLKNENSLQKQSPLPTDKPIRRATASTRSRCKA
jgi:hypothetical protein